MPYSVDACRAAAETLGLQLGSDFRDFEGASYSEKGCYSYESGRFEGMAFYGSGGTDEEMQTELTLPKYRPQGYDCASGKIFWIYFA